jgi:hypothetical protein
MVEVEECGWLMPGVLRRVSSLILLHGLLITCSLYHPGRPYPFTYDRLPNLYLPYVWSTKE